MYGKFRVDSLQSRPENFMTVVTLAFFFLLFALIIHELGHAIAMREVGFGVERLGIGLPISPQIFIRSNFLKRIFGKHFEISISPWLIGAYVKPEGNVDISKCNISTKEDVYISGAGPIANIIMLFLFSAVWVLLLPVTKSGQINYFFGLVLPGSRSLIVMMFISLAAATWMFRKWIAVWVLLPLGVYTLYFIISVISGMSLSTAVESSGGIVLISEIASKTGSLRDAIWFGMIINFVLAFTNILPLGPFDGGRILNSVLHKFAPRLSRFTQTAGTALFFGLVAFCLYADGLRVVGYFH